MLQAQCVQVLCCAMLSRFSCVWFFVTLCTIAHQAPLSMEFSRQEYWSRLAFPLPGDFPDLGIKPMSLLHGQVDSLPLRYLGSPKKIFMWNISHSCMLLTVISFDSIFFCYMSKRKYAVGLVKPKSFPFRSKF